MPNWLDRIVLQTACYDTGIATVPYWTPLDYVRCWLSDSLLRVHGFGRSTVQLDRKMTGSDLVATGSLRQARRAAQSASESVTGNFSGNGRHHRAGRAQRPLQRRGGSEEGSRPLASDAECWGSEPSTAQSPCSHKNHFIVLCLRV